MLDEKNKENQILNELNKARTLIAQLEEREKKLAQKEASMKESSTLFKVIFERAAVGITLTTPDHRLAEANSAFQEMIGYSREELIGTLVKDITHADDNAWEDDLRKDQYQLNRKEVYEKRFIRKDGSTLWVQLTSSPISDSEGSPKYVICMSADITERKEAERQVQKYQEQLRQLAIEISLAEEKVRREIAVYLHDQIAQTLTLSMMLLEDLQQSIRLPHAVTTLGAIHNLLQEVIKDMRAMILDLSPPVLEDLGLEAAIEWLSDHMLERHNIKTKILGNGLPKPLRKDVRDFVFRSIQELLINVSKHAQTDMAEVSMRCKKGEMIISVKDNGVGFKNLPQESKWVEDGSFGLFSIRERLKHFGGRLEIIQKSRRGAHVRMTIPLEA
jgi:PAS domain S-box-containing protein